MNKYLSASFALSALTLATSAPAQAAGLTNLNEGFANVSSLAPAWAFVNNSDPAPFTVNLPATWTQGNPFIPAQSGPINSFAQVDFSSTAGDPLIQNNGIISNWLITPELDFSSGGIFSFYVRTFLGNDRPEFIEIR